MRVNQKEVERRRLRRKVLNEWRGMAEPRDLSKFEHDGAEIVASIVRSLGLNDRISEEAISTEWHSIVGDFLSKHSRPAKVKNGTLHVNVLQPSILYTLQQDLSGQMLAKLQERFGKTAIKSLRFNIG